MGTACYPVGVTGCDVTAGTCRGPCRLGSWACSAGRLTCGGMVTPVLRGLRQRGQRLRRQQSTRASTSRTTRASAAAAARAASYANAIALCQSGACARGPCRPRLHRRQRQRRRRLRVPVQHRGPRGVRRPGQRLRRSRPTPTTPTCSTPPSNFCAQLGECGKGPGGSTRYPAAPPATRSAPPPPGASRPDWICNYPATVETVAGQPQPDRRPRKPSATARTTTATGSATSTPPTGRAPAARRAAGMGECQRRGTYRCQADTRADTACDFTGVPARTPAHETCDGKDNDCDGLVDESWDNPDRPWPSPVRRPTPAGACATTWPCDSGATRCTSTATRPAGSTPPRQSRAPAAPGPARGRAVMPWTLVNQAQAAGRLPEDRHAAVHAPPSGPTPARAARAARPNYFPYACTFNQNLCNGAEKARNAAVAMGSEATCTTDGAADSRST